VTLIRPHKGICRAAFYRHFGAFDPAEVVSAFSDTRLNPHQPIFTYANIHLAKFCVKL